MKTKDKFAIIHEDGIEQIGFIIHSYKEYCTIKIKDKEINKEIYEIKIIEYDELKQYYIKKGIDLTLNNLTLSVAKLLKEPSVTPSLEELSVELDIHIDFLRLELKSLNLSYMNLLELARERKINPLNKPFVRWKKYYTIISNHALNRLMDRFGLNQDEIVETLSNWLPLSVEVTKVKSLANKSFYKHGSKVHYVVNFKQRAIFVFSESFDTIITVYGSEETEWLSKAVHYIKAI